MSFRPPFMLEHIIQSHRKTRVFGVRFFFLQVLPYITTTEIDPSNLRRATTY